jgi:hypothetical protein
MHSRCGPPKFDEQDWSHFDFSRWHLDGVKLDSTSAAFADLSERLFNSEEWRQHFQTSLPSVQRAVLGFYKESAHQLEDEKTAIVQDFDRRITAARERTDEFKKAIDAAAAPPVVQPDPNTFHLSIKVTAKDFVLGLPGITVQIMEPQKPEKSGSRRRSQDPMNALVQAVTDGDGNAILTVPTERAKELDKLDTTLDVLSPTGKSLQKISGAVCIRLNQTDTKVVELADSPDIQILKNAALEARSERESRAQNLAARVDRLKQEKETSLHDLDCRLEDTRAIIASLEPATGPAPQSEASDSERATPKKDEPSKTEEPKERPPRGPSRGRRRS